MYLTNISIKLLLLLLLLLLLFILFILSLFQQGLDENYSV